jgi:SAM-dependent methyltransferase
MHSISGNNHPYLNVCYDAGTYEDQFKVFKLNPVYTQILEHTSYSQGLSYLLDIQQNFPEYIEHLDLFRLNDQYGSPHQYYYDNIGLISPSTLRYIKVLSDIKNLFGTDFTDKKIIEIGCGYGGQCFIFSQFFKNCKYYLVDLPQVQKLIDKYLNKLKVQNYQLVSMDDLKHNNESYDLVISNYAYSELDIQLQDYYYDNIIKHSDNGYFTLNFISNLFDIKSYRKEHLTTKFAKDKTINIIEEEPKTFNNNIILYF